MFHLLERQLFPNPSPLGTPSSEGDDDNDDSPPRAPAPVVPSPREDDNKHAGQALTRRLIGDHVRQAGGMVSPPRQNNKVTKSPFQTWQARANCRQTGTVTGSTDATPSLHTLNIYAYTMARTSGLGRYQFKQVQVQ